MSNYTGKIGTQPPDTNWIRCPCCHLKFSSRSLPFHINACIRAKSGSWEILTCPLCHDRVKGSEFKLHLTQGCIFRHTNGGALNGTKLKEEQRAPRLGHVHDPQAETEPVELVPCPHCHRRFATHRLPKHVSVCAKQSTTPKRTVFNASLKRTPLRGPPSARWSQPSSTRGDLSFSIGGDSGRFNRQQPSMNGKRTQPLVATMTGRTQNKMKLSIGNSNSCSLGNPLVKGRRKVARPTYSHW
jgi:hypothetical protein